MTLKRYITVILRHFTKVVAFGANCIILTEITLLVSATEI